MFRAAAFEPGDAGPGDRRPVFDNGGVPFEALALTPSDAAEQVADALERHFGARLPDSDATAPSETTGDLPPR